MTKSNEEIANRLKTFRLSKKLTQEDIASALGCSIQTYNRYEKGNRFVGSEHLESIYYMGCNINWLITGKEDMKINKNDSENDMIKIINKTADTIKEQADALNKQADAIKEQANALLNNSETANKQTDIIKMLAEKDSKQVSIGNDNVQTNITQ